LLAKGTFALETLGSGSIEGKLVTEVVETILLRSSTLPTVSFSNATTIGVVTILNVNRPDANIATFVDRLVHEAIHQLLFLLYFLSPMFTDRKNLLDSQRSGLISPWSGNELSPLNYVHACFVWYGLLFYWQSMITNPESRAESISEEEAMELFQRARSGFIRVKSLREPLQDHPEMFSEEVLSALDELNIRAQDNIKS
jgi:HEXXH motif-containing protein